MIESFTNAPAAQRCNGAGDAAAGRVSYRAEPVPQGDGARWLARPPTVLIVRRPCPRTASARSPVIALFMLQTPMSHDLVLAWSNRSKRDTASVRPCCAIVRVLRDRNPEMDRLGIDETQPAIQSGAAVRQLRRGRTGIFRDDATWFGGGCEPSTAASGYAELASQIDLPDFARRRPRELLADLYSLGNPPGWVSSTEESRKVTGGDRNLFIHHDHRKRSLSPPSVRHGNHRRLSNSGMFFE